MLSTVTLAAALSVQPALRTLPVARLPAPVRIGNILLAETAATTDEDTMLLGKVRVVGLDGLVSILPEDRGSAQVGTMLKFGGGGTGVLALLNGAASTLPLPSTASPQPQIRKPCFASEPDGGRLESRRGCMGRAA